MAETRTKKEIARDIESSRRNVSIDLQRFRVALMEQNPVALGWRRTGTRVAVW